MQLGQRFRLPAFFCALAVLVCELISRPYAEMGIGDDGPYILTAQKLAATGHIVYNGWSAAMLGWQLYLGAAFTKLFGSSLTTVRMSTLLVAMVLAFFLQRIMVRATITEWNATIGTLGLVLSPLYLLLSVTFMTDIIGLFAIVLCLYGCLRALQAATSRAAIAWLCFAVATNAIGGTSRQLAWLGVLVMIPSTLWLLRARRRVLLSGAVATLAGVVFIFGCMLWFRKQPYTSTGDVLVGNFNVFHFVGQFLHFFLDFPFLLLPIFILFFTRFRKVRPSILVLIVAISVVYLGLVIRLDRLTWLEPTAGDWIDAYGGYGRVAQGMPLPFLSIGVRVLLTILSFGGLAGLIASLFSSRKTQSAPTPSANLSWKQIGVVLGPFTITYTLLLAVRAVTIYGLFDRYALALLVVAVVCIVRFYQERIQPRIPLVGVLAVALFAIYAITITHNTFSFYRARVAVASEIHAGGVPYISVDNGWEYNVGVELQNANHINNPGIVLPAHTYVATPPPVGICKGFWYDYTPHIHPLYGVSFDPDACYGPAPFAPVRYSRWLASAPGTLYVVNYVAQPKR